MQFRIQVRPDDALVPTPLVVSNDTCVLLDLLPVDIANELRPLPSEENSEDLTAPF